MYFICAAFVQPVQSFASFVFPSSILHLAVPLPANSQIKDSRLSHFLTLLIKKKKMRQDINEKVKMTELTDDARLLVISHMPLAYAMAWRMRDCGISLDDLRQEGCLGLCEAAMRYDESTDCCFATYASHWCRKMMLMAIHRGRTAMSLQDETFLEQEDDEDLLRTGQQQRIEDALKCLLPKEQQIVRQFYGIDCKRLSLTEIAAELGFSKARASTLHLRALRKLEAALREHPLVDYLTPWLE